ncbi:MAG: phosphatase PAP2 family protein [Candidatus Paceibacterota bacterium]|jgi:hypothetical protein
MKLFKNWPIEVYVLIGLPILTAGIFIFSGHASALFSGRYLSTLIYYFLFGGSFLIIALSLINLYFLAKILIVLGKGFFLHETNKKETGKRVLKLAKSQLFFLLILALGSFLSAVLVSNLSNSSQIERIASTSNFLMNLDFSIFGEYPFFSLSAIGGFWSAIFLWAYNWLSIILPVFLLVFIFFKKAIARKFILFFFVSQIISFPIWYALPALSPYNMYIRNSIGAKLPNRISMAAKDFQPNEKLLGFLEQVDGYQNQANSYLDLTTIPSMHAGWGTGVLYYGAKLWPPLLLFLAPWMIFQMIGAVYTGEHYAVDIFAGLVVAILAIAVTEMLLALEKKYYKGGPPLRIIDYIQEDYRGFLKYMTGGVKDVRNYFFRRRA